MHRRAFVRVLGGGVILAPLVGCSTQFPAAAVAPWAGPAADTELRRWAVAHAVLSPNSHNRQPWLVDLSQADAITLYVDRERLLPETDPWFRQIVVSQGTFLETLVLALRQRGVEPQVQLFPRGEPAPRTLDDRPVARITWAAPGSAAPDPLFAQVLRRHTAKGAYDTQRPVSAATLQALKGAAMARPGVDYGYTVDAERLPALRQLCMDAARVEVGTPRTALESARLMRIGPDEIALHRDGISLNGLMPRLVVMVGAFDRSQAPATGSSAYEQTIKRFEEHAGTAMGFVWLTTAAGSGGGRSAEVEAGRAYQRLHLAATAVGLQMHPMSQAPQEFAEMQPHYRQLHTLLLGPAQPAGRVVQLFCRVGYCADQPHTPRRDPASLVKTMAA